MACRHKVGKPLSEPMMGSLLTHICITRPQWVKPKFMAHSMAWRKCDTIFTYIKTIIYIIDTYIYIHTDEIIWINQQPTWHEVTINEIAEPTQTVPQHVLRERLGLRHHKQTLSDHIVFGHQRLRLWHTYVAVTDTNQPVRRRGKSREVWCIYPRSLQRWCGLKTEEIVLVIMVVALVMAPVFYAILM